MMFKYLRLLLILSLLSIALFPYFGVIDPIASQWLILNIINVLGLLFIIYGIIFDHLNPKFFLFQSKTFLYYGLYLLLALISILYSMNAYEAVIEFSRYYNTFISFILIYFLLDWEKDKKILISWITFITFLEVFFVLKPFFEDSLTNGFNFKRSQRYNGLAANINITAFSLLLKLPFLFYSTLIFNSRVNKILSDILISGIIFCLIILKSRASFISLFLILILLIIYYFLNRRNKFFLKFSLKLILIFCMFLSLEVFITNSSNNSINRIGSITNSSLEDESINQRLNYYQSAFLQLKEKPFGEGLGNWKIKSIKLNKDIINDYIVPYHMHNDFLQNLAELGLIGFILYGLIFLTLLLKLLKSIFWYQINSKLDYFLLLGLIVYIIDASLNFPMARPIIQVYMVLLFTLILRNINDYYSENNFNKILISILSAGTFLTLYFNYQSYNTYKKQIPLMADFNFGKYTIDVKEYEKIDFKWPSLSVTTIPLNSMIARYYENANEYEKAIEILHQTKNLNPYLGWNEAVLAASYFDTKKIDSAIYYSEKAYHKIPNNNLHIRLMLGAAKEKNNEKLMDSVFNNAKKRVKRDPEIWLHYLNLKTAFHKVGDSVLSETAKLAVEKFPKNKKLLQLYKNVKIGQQRVNLAIKESKKAKANYLDEKYDLAEQQYLEAYRYDPLEYSYLESLVGMNVFLERFEKALEYYKIFEQNHKTIDGKIEFLSGIAFENLGQNNKACKNFNIALSKGYKAAREKLKNCN